ncbi:hypothetical protein V8G54_033754 [Vigna mungo]|uniref:CASP-like protein n=1 Tax=Vigna mungo TaxID=3915 RepID=A0AAQ3MNV2_VIGMU
MEKTNVVEGSRSPMQMKMGDELEGNTNNLRTVETFLRLLPVGLCVSALVLMLKNSQQNQYGSVDYTDLGAFKYLVLTYIVLAAGAVSTEVLYLAENGNTATTWSSACGSFGRFCNKVTASITITFVAVLCYVLLSLISSYKLFTKYDAPAACRPTAPIEVAAFPG